MENRLARKLAAILYVDVAGYSRVPSSAAAYQPWVESIKCSFDAESDHASPIWEQAAWSPTIRPASSPASIYASRRTEGRHRVSCLGFDIGNNGPP